MRTPYLSNYQKLLYPFIILFYILILLIISSINEFMIYIYYFILANQLANTKKDWDSFSKKEDNIKKLSNISREFSKYIDRATYPEGILRILSRKHYIDSPLLLSELDV
jgi:hypothetical protein